MSYADPNFARNPNVHAMPDEQPLVGSHLPQGCTCPSGDGSVRWPCPVHAPAPVAQHATIWQWLTSDADRIGERWQAINARWDGENGRAGLEAAAVAAMRADQRGPL
jgi:hypothetical protein